MNGYVAEFDTVNEPGWCALLDGFADANVYQTWAYGAVCWGEAQLSHAVLTRDGAPRAIAQVRVLRLPVVGAGVAYVRWGPLCVRCEGRWDAAAYRAMMQALVNEYVVRRRLLLRVVPQHFEHDDAAPDVQGAWAELGMTESTAERRYETIRIDVRQSEDTLRRRLSPKWRNKLNIAERNHLEIIDGHDECVFRRFQAMYLEMLARKRFETTVDINAFARIQERLPDRHKLTTLLCVAGDQTVAGAVIATVGDSGLYLLGATADAGLQAKGSYLLQWHAIRRLKALGHTWYDLGGVNRTANPGVFSFKSGMGGECVLQLGRQELAGGGMSSIGVSIGESVRGLVRRIAATRHSQWERRQS